MRWTGMRMFLSVSFTWSKFLLHFGKENENIELGIGEDHRNEEKDEE